MNERRVRLAALVVGLLLLAAALIPWPTTLRIPAVLTAAQQAPAFAPRPARVEQILVSPGQQVKAGDVLVRLSDPALVDALARSYETAQGLEQRLARRTADARDRSESLVLARELRLEHDRAAGLKRERERLAVRAPIDGQVMDVALNLHTGRWIDDKTRLVLVGRPEALQARGYVDGEDLARVAEGNAGRFIDETRQLPALKVQVERIAASASESVDAALLTSVAGGTVPVRSDGHALRPQFAAFEIVAAVQGPLTQPPLTEVRGELQVKGHAQSMAGRSVRRIVQVLVRESML